MAMDENEIEERLGKLDGWNSNVRGDGIVREFKCGDFVGSVKFVDSLVGPAEDMGHHPDVEISWDTVTVRLTSHSEGGLTENDFELASRIDKLA